MKQRTPFEGGSVIIACAADEFVPAIGFSYEAGAAEGCDEVAAYAREKVEI
jgi:hypothetical protein